MSNAHESTHTEKGASLARGPAWIIGSVLAVFGLVFFFRASGTPLTTGGFPQGNPDGRTFLGIEVNGWTAWLTAAAGVLVLIGVLQHAVAKAMSLVVGIALAAAAGMALVAGDVLGLAAANAYTALGWGVAAALLIITALLPRRTHDVADRDRDRGSRTAEQDRVARPSRVTHDEREPVAAGHADRIRTVDDAGRDGVPSAAAPNKR